MTIVTVHKASREGVKLRPASQYSGFSVWKLRQLIWAGVLPVVQLEPGGPCLVDVRAEAYPHLKILLYT